MWPNKIDLMNLVLLHIVVICSVIREYYVNRLYNMHFDLKFTRICLQKYWQILGHLPLGTTNNGIKYVFYHFSRKKKMEKQNEIQS